MPGEMPFRGKVEVKLPVTLMLWACCAFNTSLKGHSLFGASCRSTCPSGEQSGKERTLKMEEGPKCFLLRLR